VAGTVCYLEYRYDTLDEQKLKQRYRLSNKILLLSTWRRTVVFYVIISELISAITHFIATIHSCHCHAIDRRLLTYDCLRRRRDTAMAVL